MGWGRQRGERWSRNPTVKLQVCNILKLASHVFHIVKLLYDRIIYHLPKSLVVVGILHNRERGSMQQVYISHSNQKHFPNLCGFTYNITNWKRSVSQCHLQIAEINICWLMVWGAKQQWAPRRLWVKLWFRLTAFCGSGLRNKTKKRALQQGESQMWQGPVRLSKWWNRSTPFSPACLWRL